MSTRKSAHASRSSTSVITVSMPSGVEHSRESGKAMLIQTVITVSMPSGVEHYSSSARTRMRSP